MISQYYAGSVSAAPQRIPLRAGQLTLEYELGTLRYIRLGSHEIVRSIYAAVRDHNWGTVPAVLRDVEIRSDETSFRITFTSDHQQGDIHFVWRGTLEGSADSQITFSFDGEALTRFQRNRIGFCVLHPMDVAGSPVSVEHTTGVVEAGTFPTYIAPHQPFFDIRALTHEVMPGMRAEVRMEGDTFEMEDQRNWTDASFKTYCTPLGLPYPQQVNAGMRVQQSISVRLIGRSSESTRLEQPQSLYFDPSHSSPLPPLGLGWAEIESAPSDTEFARLKALSIHHIRVDLRLNAGWQERLANALNSIERICQAVELAVHFSAGAVFTDELEALGKFIDAHPFNGWLLIFRAGEIVTQSATYEAAQARLRMPTGLGTDAFFTELNRNRPAPALGDVVAYSVNPQVHAFDHASLVETLPAMGATVISAGQFTNRPIAVTPITFKMRWNPNATAAEKPAPPDQLPRQVDPRQMSLFGAGWTMGAIAALALPKVHSLTFFETLGWLGVMEQTNGSRLPVLFPSIAGGVYPMYHVFADVGEMSGAQVLTCTSSDALRFSGLTLQHTPTNRLRMLIANHTSERQPITLPGLQGTWALKSLDERTVEFAMSSPEAYRAQTGSSLSSDGTGLSIELLPYGVARLDQVH